MANHAKVITGKTLDPAEVNEIVQRLNKEKLGGVFTITLGRGHYGEHQWFLQYKDEGFIGMHFWLTDNQQWGEEKDGKWIEFDEPKVISKQSCIEFRHGHSFQFMWWVEGLFRENLGVHYNAEMWDDGVGECGKPDPERYETFKTYVTRIETKTKAEVKAWKNLHFNWQKKDIPADLAEKLNLDFEI